ncbi:hypothetical protein C5167_015683 [Papaver somniferum]|uniref:SPX domain-containing protein n=1 Tax=Papaver somniferum TaxID=3469 RepID=A0A4Y7J8M1_PAPSO|nr:hypothetical protein C5167_015683 [Papaver somniferum]
MYCLIVVAAFCNGTFFPSLHGEMSAIVGCFNRRAQKLLQKLFNMIKRKIVKGDDVAVVEEGKELVGYAMINAIAIRKILKQYEKLRAFYGLLAHKRRACMLRSFNLHGYVS